MNISDILTLKFPDKDFTKDIIIQDDGKGPYIAKWNVPNVPKPTNQDLSQWATDLDLQYRQKVAVSKRIYPPIPEQLDMIYKDKINNTTVWVDTITAIKAANPKPME